MKVEEVAEEVVEPKVEVVEEVKENVVERMSECCGYGNLCNQLFRNIAFSIIAEKFDLLVNYNETKRCDVPNVPFIKLINSLGIDLFSGTKKYTETKIITDDNYFDIYNQEEINFNLSVGDNTYFQTNDISNLLYKYFNREDIKNKIIKKNPFEKRYNNNNDIFIHVRLGDVEWMYPGFEYVEKCLNKIQNNYDNIYIATNDFNSSYIKEIKNKYPDLKFIDKSPIESIQFGSTCKHIILSNGSFSATIGFFGYYSDIYYPSQMFSWWNEKFGPWEISKWNKIF